MKTLLPSADPNAAEDLVAAGDVGHAVDDRRRGVHVAFGPRLPRQLAGLRREPVQVRVVGADQQQVAGDHRRGFHFPAGLERPRRLAGRDVDRVHGAARVADVHEPVRHRRRRLADPVGRRPVFPLERSVRQVHRVEIARLRSHVDDAVFDGGRGLDRVTRFVGPEQLERRRERGGRRAEERGGSAELRPAGRRDQSAG